MKNLNKKRFFFKKKKESENQCDCSQVLINNEIVALKVK